ncbi:hypothetical protein N7490_005185 [Penicillium lividum]|nr:hypothetical protein N7490_005185 [Penicillium lividum]
MLQGQLGEEMDYIAARVTMVQHQAIQSDPDQLVIQPMVWTVRVTAQDAVESASVAFLPAMAVQRAPAQVGFRLIGAYHAGFAQVRAILLWNAVNV